MTGTVNVAVTFDGSGSRDPDGRIVTYYWTFGDGTQASVSTSSISHTYTAAGTYTVTLWVYDNGGAWSWGDVAIATIGTSSTSSTTSTSTTTSTLANRPPHADAGPDIGTTPGVATTLNGSGSSDPDGTISSYTWSFGDGTTGSGMMPSHVYATAGTYTAMLTVVDNLGAMSSDSAVVSVGSALWSRAIGGAGSDVAMAVAVDASGNTVVGGAFRNTITVGTTTLVSAGNADMLLVKYSPSGSVLWARGVGGAGDEGVQGVAIDPRNGDVVVGGWFTGTANFGGVSFTANGTQDMVVAKYAAATGALVWAKQFGGSYQESANAVAVDASGNVVITGFYKGTITFGSVTLRTPQLTDSDAFLAKLRSDGTPLWAKDFANTSDEEGTTVAVDGTGNIALGGWFTGTYSLGGTSFIAAGGMPDGFVARFDPNGTHVWSRRIGHGTPENYDFVYGVAFDHGGNVLVTGTVGGSVDFGGGTLTGLGVADAFVVKYSGASGAHVWSRLFGGNSTDIGYGVAADPNDNVLVTGAFTGTASFGNTTLTALGTGTTNIFVAKYAPTGGALWARGFGGMSSDSGRAVAAAPTGHAVAAGIFYDSASFDGNVISSAGLADGFVYHGAP